MEQAQQNPERMNGMDEDYDLPLHPACRQRIEPVAGPLDALEQFQLLPPEFGEHARDAVCYWAAKRVDPYWKDLAMMALEIHTIPAMSGEPERVFSAAKITLSDRRCRMGDELLNALECCKAW
jgi:hypothetical protein